VTRETATPDADGPQRGEEAFREIRKSDAARARILNGANEALDLSHGTCRTRSRTGRASVARKVFTSAIHDERVRSRSVTG